MEEKTLKKSIKKSSWITLVLILISVILIGYGLAHHGFEMTQKKGSAICTECVGFE